MKLLLKRVLSHFPTPLPVGMTAWAKFSADVLELAGPIANPEDMEAALAMEVIHSAAGVANVRKSYFVNRLRKVASNQVAGAAYSTIKTKRDAQIAAAKAAEEAAKQLSPTVEDTTAAQVVSNAKQSS